MKYFPEDLWTLGLQLVDQHLWKALKPLRAGELLAEVDDLGGIFRFYSPAPLAVCHPLFPAKVTRTVGVLVLMASLSHREWIVSRWNCKPKLTVPSLLSGVWL